MTSRLWAMGVAVVLAAGAASSAMRAWSGQADPNTLLRLDVLVEDERGRPLTGLSREQFEVVVDGQPRPLQSFAPAAPAPLVAGILVDVTASLHRCPAGVAGLPSSVRMSRFESLSTLIPPAVEPFDLQGLRRGDEVLFGTVGRLSARLGPFEWEDRRRPRAWTSLFERPPVEWLGPSPIWDATLDMTKALAPRAGRRAIVLVTDGLASGNQVSWRDVAAAAAAAGVAVSVVAEETVLPTQPLTPFARAGIDPLTPLRSLAAATGGIYALDPAAPDTTGFRADPASPCFKREPGRYVRGVIERMRSPYAIAISAQDDGAGLHTLEVRVSRAGAVVHARRAFAIERQTTSGVSFVEAPPGGRGEERSATRPGSGRSWLWSQRVH
jgi:hypothetical protein